eukprot:TRINITY_DN107755_c0_g1_i1.p1 TRINITY_DN107755_c0_g1~~TRINITY_DN107755_c0_g1_i1.p1  ORF type:complete len:164 (+),score=22.10 TRINITY_DN107755_c0_g1_i1:70-561(+)
MVRFVFLTVAVMTASCRASVETALSLDDECQGQGCSTELLQRNGKIELEGMSMPLGAGPLAHRAMMKSLTQHTGCTQSSFGNQDVGTDCAGELVGYLVNKDDSALIECMEKHGVEPQCAPCAAKMFACGLTKCTSQMTSGSQDTADHCMASQCLVETLTCMKV